MPRSVKRHSFRKLHAVLRTRFASPWTGVTAAFQLGTLQVAVMCEPLVHSRVQLLGLFSCVTVRRLSFNNQAARRNHGDRGELARSRP